MNARNPLARLVALLSVMSLVLAACGGDDAANDVTTTTTPAATTVAATPGGDPELVWSFAYEEEGRIRSIAVAPNGETVVVSPPFANGAHVHQLADGALLDVFVYRYGPEDLAFSPDGSLLAVGVGLLGVALTTDDGSDPPGLEGLTRYGGFSGVHLHDGFDSVVAFSPDGRHLATGNRDGMVWLWRLTDGEQVAELEDPAGEQKTGVLMTVTSLDYHPSGTLLAATHFDCVVNIWDVDAASIIHTIDLTSIGCYGAKRFAFSPDGTVMAGVVTEDWVSFVRVWNVDDATPIVDFPMDFNHFADLSFSPDGRMLATVASGSLLGWPPPTIWDVSTATLLYTLESDRNPRPTAVSFTPDGGHVVVGYYDGTIELWRLPGDAANDVTTTTTPAATTTQAPTTTAVSALAWTRIPYDPEVFGDGRLAAAYGVAGDDSGFVAVGWDSIPVGQGGRAVVWHSADGGAWERVGDAEMFVDGSFMRDVTAGGPGFVAVGGVPAAPTWSAAVWTSRDGLTWSAVPDDGEVFGGAGIQEMYSVAVGGPGLVAVGEDNGAAAVWVSTDGLAWARVPHEHTALGPEPLTIMLSVTAGGPGLVAVGLATPDDVATRPENAWAAVWTSVDGYEWSRVAHDGPIFGDTGLHAMMSVASAAQGLVAVGTVVEAGTSYGAVWTSRDGLSWSRIPRSEPALQGEGVIKAVIDNFGSGALAVGQQESGVVLWLSDASGQSWTRVAADEPALAGMGAGGNAIVAAESGLVVVVGQDFAVAAIWIGRPG